MEITDYVSALFGADWDLGGVILAYLIYLGALELFPFLLLVPYLVFFIVSLPLRRKERARLFLDLLEQGLNRGQSAEQTVQSFGRCCEPLFGSRLQELEPALERGEPFDRALDLVPGFLPPAVVGLLQTGAKVGDLRRVLPACRRLLNDARSQTLAALNYFLLLTFALIPLSLWVMFTIQVFVLPKLEEITRELGAVQTGAAAGMLHHLGWLAAFQLGLLFMFLIMVLMHVLGPLLRRRLQPRRFPIFDEIAYHIPWRHKRIKRDFASALATLLDAGFDESAAVEQAAQSTANLAFQRRADRVIRQLQSGLPLESALLAIEPPGELQWRVRNALASSRGFTAALNGWVVGLDAKAFQQHQGMVQLVTSMLVAVNGLGIGLVAYGLFHVMIGIIEAGMLW